MLLQRLTDVLAALQTQLSVTANNLAPNLTVALSGLLPDEQSGKASSWLLSIASIKLHFTPLPDSPWGQLLLQVTVDYNIPHLTLKSTIGLTQNPKVVVAATTGQKGVVAGAEATYDTNKGNVTTWNAGAGYNAADFQAHVLLTDAGTLLDCSLCMHALPKSTCNTQA